MSDSPLEKFEPENVERLCIIKVYRAQAFLKQIDWKEEYESLPDDMKNTSAYHFFMASIVAHPLQKEHHYLQAIKAGGAAEIQSRIFLAKLRAGRGLLESSVADMVSVMGEYPHSSVSESAALAILDSWKSLDPFEQLITFLSGFSGTESYGLQKIAKISLDNNWNVLSLYCFSQAVEQEEDASNVNNLGRARQALRLPSLAYLAYSRATELGATVSLCNMAAQQLYQPVPAAGLKFLAGRNGGFDSSSRDFPYHTLASLEASVQAEELKDKELLVRGRLQFESLWILAGLVLQPSRISNMMSNGNIIGENFKATIVDGKLEPAGWDKPIPVRPFANLLHRSGHIDAMAFVLLCEDEVRGLEFGNFAEASGMNWLKWKADDNSPPNTP